MRQIKFRCWNKLYKQMQNWEHLIGYCDVEYLFGKEKAFEGHDVVPMQYTGLKDIDGVEIYEGDILETPFDYPANDYLDYEGESGMFRGKVRYMPSRGFYMSQCIAKSDCFDTGYKWSKRKDLQIRATRSVVIGNIHENPELLKVNDE